MSDETGTRLSWRKSSRSGDTNCVEVAVTGPAVLVRDSKDPAGGVLEFSPASWAGFIRSLRPRDWPAVSHRV